MKGCGGAVVGICSDDIDTCRDDISVSSDNMFAYRVDSFSHFQLNSKTLLCTSMSPMTSLQLPRHLGTEASCVSYIAFLLLFFSPLIPLINPTSARRFEICDSRKCKHAERENREFDGFGEI